MTDGEKLQYLAGQVYGLRVVLSAPVSAHPAPGVLIHELERLTERQIGTAAPIDITEHFLAGQKEATEDFRDRLAEIRSRRDL